MSEAVCVALELASGESVTAHHAGFFAEIAVEQPFGIVIAVAIATPKASHIAVEAVAMLAVVFISLLGALANKTVTRRQIIPAGNCYDLAKREVLEKGLGHRRLPILAGCEMPRADEETLRHVATRVNT